MPDDEFRYELDDGVLIASPAPSSLHQLAVTRLAYILGAACPPGLVVLAGVGVNITRFQHRVPDLAVVRADSFGSVFQGAAAAAGRRGRLAGGRGCTTGTGRRTSTRASASRPTGSSHRSGTGPTSPCSS